jgi:Kef-type K+ transport system membrane component KefB
MLFYTASILLFLAVFSTVLVLDDLAVFFIILLSGLVFSEFFKRLHLPYVVALVVAGIIIGPSVLDLVNLSPPLEFMGSIGIVFLMFMAGLETRTDILSRGKRKLAVLVALNAVIPAVTGFSITFLFGYDLLATLVISTIFISSSVAIVVPLLEQRNLIQTELGSFIIGAVVLEDIASLFMLSVVLQTADPLTALPLYIFIPLVAISIVLFKFLLPKIYRWFLKVRRRIGYEEDVLFLLVVTVAVAAFFELLGLHAIVAGFLVGLILSGSLRSEKTRNKLHAITYGLFIPIFLLTVGIETDLSVFSQLNGALLLVIAITAGLIISKVFSGFIAAKINQLSNRQAFFVGFSTTPQVSTSLAAAFTAYQFGIIDVNLQTSIVILSIVTVLMAPIVLSRLATTNSSKAPQKTPTNKIPEHLSP